MTMNKTFRKAGADVYQAPSMVVVELSSEQPFLVVSQMFQRQSNLEAYTIDEELINW